MTQELPDHSLTSVVSDTKPPSDTSINLDPSAERSNTADLQDNTLCSRCKRNTAQTPDDQSDQDTGSEVQSVRSMTGSESYSDGSDFHFERETHWSEIVGPGRLSPRVEGKFLQLIKKKMLFLWGVGTEDVPNISIDTHGLKTLRFKMDNHAVISLAWDEHSRAPTYRKEVTRAQSSICQAWPQDRNVFGVEQFVIASNGRDQATVISLKYIEQSYMDEVVASKNLDILHAGYEDIWHRWCFGADEVLAIKKSPIPLRGKTVYCTSSSQSKGFRHFPLTAFAVAVSDNEPFSVADQERYNFKLKRRIIPITQYLFEVCKAFDRSVQGWGKTLDSIDELVHVNLNDFDDRERIEDLMFDKSFNRSRDYFVALQLLRIMDEWINEAVSSIQQLREDTNFMHPGFSTFEIKDNLDAVDRYMKEKADPVQKRLQKKKEEINSLRDGLFNATSLRESTKAMALNQAIYVFTVVTVLFTPVSFLATFWALPFLNNPREGSDIVPEPSAFRNSFIVMPLLTYALVLGIAWHVGRENPNATLTRLKEKGRHLPMLDLHSVSMGIPMDAPPEGIL
ncbi:hypothetical protein FGRA07_09461 [Fusarium graminearum]|nr:hypothetical protein FGRA07_09461 [Fusarium graminearum]